MSHHISGNCSCGRIKFEIKILKINVVNCHCTTCRKLNGSAFSTYCVVSGKRFKFIEGEELLSRYSFSGDATKHFCKHCGSPVYNLNAQYPNLRMVHLGALNLAEEIKPNVNIFCQSKLSWVSVADEITNFEKKIEP